MVGRGFWAWPQISGLIVAIVWPEASFAQPAPNKITVLPPAEISTPIDLEASGFGFSATALLKRSGMAVGAIRLACSVSPKSITLSISFPDEMAGDGPAVAWVQVSSGDKTAAETGRAKDGTIVLHSRSNSISAADAMAYGLPGATKVQWMFQTLFEADELRIDMINPNTAENPKRYAIKISTKTLSGGDRKNVKEVINFCSSLKFD